MDAFQTLVSVLGGAGSSVYFGEKPEDNDECVVYNIVSTNPTRSHEGNLFDKYRIQLDLYSTSLSTNQNMFTNVRNLLDLNSTNFKLAYLTNRFVVKDIQPDLVRSIVEFYIWQ